MKKIEIVIKNGKIYVKTEGFQGEACIQEVNRLLEGLEGVHVETQEITPTQEYYAKGAAKAKAGL